MGNTKKLHSLKCSGKEALSDRWFKPLPLETYSFLMGFQTEENILPFRELASDDQETVTQPDEALLVSDW